MQRKLTTYLGLSGMALLAGAILPLAFAPFGYYGVAEISLVLLLITWFKSTPKSAFWYGWLFGAAFFGCGISWVYISVHVHGKAPVVLSLAIVALLVAFMALYFAIQGYLLQRFYPNNRWQKFLLAFPASFALLEWIRGWFLSGFPWLFLGYGHVDSALAGFATIFGVYGVSFLIALTAGAIFYGFYVWRNWRVVVGLILFIVLLWGIGAGLTRIHWTKPSGEPLPVSLIQGNVTQERKWNPLELWSILNSYAALSAENYASKIIVWPEAAIPTFPENVKLYLKLLSFAAKKNGTTILSGIPFYDQEVERYYNGIIAFGVDTGRYYKRSLVPFGEYMPLRFLLDWLHNFVLIPMSDFSPGGKNQPDLLAQGILLAPFICYEIAYPGLVLGYLPKAGLLLTVCDDSWFGESIAAYQHLEIARMRSLEVGRYQLLSTSMGISAIIDDQGKIVKEAPAFQQAVVNAKVQSFTGSTPWVGFGQYLWLVFSLLGLWFAKPTAGATRKE